MGFCHLPPKEAEMKYAVTAHLRVQQEPPLLMPSGKHPPALSQDRRLPGPRLSSPHAAGGTMGGLPALRSLSHMVALSRLPVYTFTECDGPSHPGDAGVWLLAQNGCYLGPRALKVNKHL